MNRLNSLLSAGVKLTSTGTAVASPIPFDSSGYFPRFVRVVASGAGCYVKVGDIGVTAVAGDCMVQPLDGAVLNVAGCKAISAISVSGTSSVTVVPLERGSWNYDQRTLDYDFTSLSAVPAPVTYSGGSSRTFFGSDGLLKVQGYNLLLQSNKFDTTWSVARLATPSQTGVSAPDGTASWVVTEDATAANTHALIQGYSFSTATSYTFSIYAKMGTQRWINLTLPGSVFTSGDVYFDLQNGVKGTENGGATGAITSVGNGWYRCSISKTSTGAATANLIVYSTDSGSSVTVATPSARTLYLYGAQLEAGSTASQYSPTTTAANSAPRLDYDPSTLLPRGLLVEEQRVNLLLQSESFDNAAWSATVSVTANQATSPSGAATADLITVSGASQGVYNSTGVVVTASTTYTFSVYVKLGTMVSSQYKLAFYDVTGAAFISTDVVPTLTDVGGGWYRATTTVTTPVGCLSLRCYAFRNTATVNATCYLWGAQLELGSFPTSYIPTTTASATRSADSVSMTGTNFSSWYSQAQGTFVAEYVQGPSDGTNTRRVLSVSDGTSANRIEAVRAGTGSAQAISSVGGASNFAPFISGVPASTATVKIALSYDASGKAMSRDGGAVGTDATAPPLASLNRFDIGNTVGGSAATCHNGHIRRIQYYNVRVSNSTLQALTS